MHCDLQEQRAQARNIQHVFPLVPPLHDFLRPQAAECGDIPLRAFLLNDLIGVKFQIYVLVI